MEEKVLSKPESTYEKLKSEILYLELEPGQALSEIETSKRFGVSRTPVRDAFKRLENEGLLEIKPHVGTFVSLIDLEHITDILYMREKLELAVMEDFSKALSQIQAFKLNFILTRQKQLFGQELSEKKLAKEFILSDNEFHRTIFELSGKGNIWEYLATLEHHYMRFRMFMNLTDKDTLYRLYENHLEIVKDIMQGNMEHLQTLFSGHLYDGVQRSLEKVYEKPSYFKNLSVE